MRHHGGRMTAGLVTGLLLCIGLLFASGLPGFLRSPASAASSAGGGETAQAHKALLVLSDLPAGWTATPVASSTSAGSSFTGAPQLASCLGVPRQLVAAMPPEVNSAQMSDQAGTLQVQDTISIFPSATVAREEFAAVSNHKAPGCLRSVLNSVLAGSGGTSGSGGNATTAESLSVTRTASPKGTTAFDVDTTLSSQGQSQPIREELVVCVHGQLLDALDFSSYGSSTPPASLVQHLTALAQSRL